MPDPARPTPAMMPKTRTVIPAAPPSRPRARAAFKVDRSLPRRGVADAVVWPDTGVLLALHADPHLPDLPDRFRAHYAKRTRLAPRVAAELRNLAWIPTPSRHDEQVRGAASEAVNRLLLGDRPLQQVELAREDLASVEAVKAQLRAVPGSDPDKSKHGGEAEAIALAAKAAKAGGRHLLLANDAGASVVAAQHGLSTRHVADVIAEFACADTSLAPSDCLTRFHSCARVSSPPVSCCPTDETAFTCAQVPDGCPECDTETA